MRRRWLQLSGANAQLVKRVLAYARPYQGWIVLAVGCAVIASAAEVLQLATLQKMVNSTVNGAPWFELARQALVLLGLAVVTVIADAAHAYRMSLSSQRMALDLQNEIHLHLHKLPEEFFVENPPGELAYRVFQDAGAAQQMVGVLAGALIRNPLSFLAVGGYMLFLDPLLSGLAIGLFSLVVLSVRLSTRRLQGLAKDLAANRAAIAERFLSLIRARDLLRFYDPDHRRKQSLPEQNEEFHHLGARYLKRKCLIAPLTHLLTMGLAVICVWTVAHRLETGTMVPSTAALLLAALVLLYRPLKSLSGVGATLRESLAGAQRVFEILDQKPFWTDSERGIPLIEPPRRIELQAVNYSFGNGRFDLPRVDLTLEAGEVVALIGASGSGKSTLSRLLARTLRPSTGRIFWNGCPYEQIAWRSFAAHVAYVPQRCAVLGNTIRDEIAAGEMEVSLAELERTAERTELLDWIRGLPQQWDTRVGPGGIAISGGQRQRLALARALLRPRWLYILDETTSELDLASEQKVVASLCREVRQRRAMALFISHRLTNLHLADAVLRMDENGVQPCRVPAGFEDQPIADLATNL